MIVRIYGANGTIGQVHSRIFSDLGARVYYGDPSCAAVDAVSICTPPHIHLEQIVASLDKNESVFCEKPLFWHEGIKMRDVKAGLSLIENHPNRRIFLNTPNTVFLDCIKHKHRDVRRFSFTFHTQGGREGENIAADLLPHGFSLIQHLFGHRKIDSFIRSYGNTFYNCYFDYGETWVEFYFREDPEKERKFAFTIDGMPYSRIQEGEGRTYKAHLEECNGTRHLIGDPFQVAIKKFIDYCRNDNRYQEDGFELAAQNMMLMAQCLCRR